MMLILEKDSPVRLFFDEKEAMGWLEILVKKFPAAGYRVVPFEAAPTGTSGSTYEAREGGCEMIPGADIGDNI